MAVEPDSAGVRFPPPFVYLGALLLGLAAERFVTLRSFGVDWRLLIATGAAPFIAGTAMVLAAAGLFPRIRARIPPPRPATVIVTTGPYRWTRNPMYLGAVDETRSPHQVVLFCILMNDGVRGYAGLLPHHPKF
ncbi:isoprenylcysteine carboxylmethyltransferase family protein [Agrobacterium tumefaciens]|nr:isoprenylcysteine carboxylmethyltransferase family protein [Agrobacterium tumefaciens]TQN60594.1 isoprenylcysteine carboxylmethyltransferase family protein [Agrobacterium tumefaciens]